MSCITKKDICELYDIVQMNSTSFEYKKEATTEVMDSKKESNRSVATSFTSSISNSSQNADCEITASNSSIFNSLPNVNINKKLFSIEKFIKCKNLNASESNRL